MIMKDIHKIAETEGLEVIETTTGNNGYPRELKYALIGFNNFTQAEEIAEKYVLEAQKFRKKNGWQLWSRGNHTVHKAFEIDAETFGDDYHVCSYDNEAEFIDEELLRPLSDGIVADFDELEVLVQQKRRIWDEVESKEDDEIVIICDGFYYCTHKKETMQYYYDTWTYVIGLI